ncbi:MAG: hypothetical protein ACJATI_005429 [Halioglobus sp.]|jgi:hypothetical protein
MDSPHVIGLMKTNRFVSVDGKNNKLNTIPELRRSSIKRCKKLNCQYIPLEGQLQKCGNDNIPNPHAGAAKLKDIDKY